MFSHCVSFRCDFNKYTLMVLQCIGAIEEERDRQRKLSGEDDSGHDENDELMLIRSTANSEDDDNDVEMYSSSAEEEH